MSLKQRWQELMANQPLKRKLYEIIFGSDTRMGKSFDILLSIFLTIFDSLFTNPWLVGSLVFWSMYSRYSSLLNIWRVSTALLVRVTMP